MGVPILVLIPSSLGANDVCPGSICPPGTWQQSGQADEDKLINCPPGKSRKNRILDRDVSGTVGQNHPGATKKKYGPEGRVEKEKSTIRNYFLSKLYSIRIYMIAITKFPDMQY